MDDRRFRIIILGAGFSRPAGFPLGIELWRDVLYRIRSELGTETHVDRDLSDFLDFKRLTTGAEVTADALDYEEFLSYLDIEHYLGLRGSGTWSSEGNEAQLLLKGYIGKVLWERVEALTALPPCYIEFAKALRPGDFILSYNYDTLLEAALEYVGLSYRLFPSRFATIGVTANTVDDTKNEVVLLKLHGSIDWFSSAAYEESLEVAAAFHYPPKHPVFGADRVVSPVPIVDGPREPEDPLLSIHRVLDPSPLYTRTLPAAPFILAPSYSKILYSDRLRDFWHGAGRAGGLNLGMAIIGYSLPTHDHHALQVLFSLTRNYTESWWSEEIIGKRKLPLRFVDFRPDDASLADFKRRYSFINWDRTELFRSGFSSDAVDFLFREQGALAN